MVYEDLILRLEKMNKGSNVHVINKAIFHLKIMQKNEKRSDLEKKVIKNIYKSLITEDWKEVRNLMLRWF